MDEPNTINNFFVSIDKFIKLWNIRKNEIKKDIIIIIIFTIRVIKRIEKDFDLGTNFSNKIGKDNSPKLAGIMLR